MVHIPTIPSISNIGEGILNSLGESWIPTDLAGCVLWLRSDLGITKDGADRVGTWADQSGNGNDLTQATDSKKPVWTANQRNGYAGLIFDGIDDFMSGTFTWNQPEVIYAVLDIVGALSIGEYLWDGITANLMAMITYGAPDGYYPHAGTGWSTNVAVSTDWAILKMVYNGASSVFRVNNDSPVTGNIGTNNAGGFTLGAQGNTLNSYAINCAEIAGYNAVPNDGDDTFIMAYLNGRYTTY